MVSSKLVVVSIFLTLSEFFHDFGPGVPFGVVFPGVADVIAGGFAFGMGGWGVRADFDENHLVVAVFGNGNGEYPDGGGDIVAPHAFGGADIGHGPHPIVFFHQSGHGEFSEEGAFPNVPRAIAWQRGER